MEPKCPNIKLTRLPTLNTERLSSQYSLPRFRTLPSLLTDRTEKTRIQLCQLFRVNSKQTPREIPQSTLQYHRNEHKNIIQKAYKQYLKDKQLVNQLTTKGLRTHFKPKSKRIKTIEQMIENIDENNSPIQEQIKIADFMLNPKNSTFHNIELLEDHFNYGEETPAKLKNFSKNVVAFANNLQTYMTKQKTQKLLNIQRQVSIQI